MPVAHLRPILAALALAPLALAGPAAAQSSATSTDETAPPPVAEPEATAVIATVNGVDVLLGDLILMRSSLPEQFRSMPDQQLYPALVSQAISQVLLAQKGREAGFEDDEIGQLRARAGMRNFLADAYMSRLVAEATTDEALRARYALDYENAEPAQEVRASHILVADKALADDLHAQLADGADFAELAGEHGTDGTKANGGDLGYFERERMVPAFADAAFAAEVGVPTEPVQSDFGWHLILVTDKRDKPIPSFESVRGDIARTIAQEIARAEVEAVMESAEIAYPAEQQNPSAIRREDLLLPN